MDKWQPIETAPEDTLILLYKAFDGFETPCVVVGELSTHKGRLHHLWCGPYAGTINVFNGEVSGWDEKFTHWRGLN
jgi:hypothetical protein